MPTPFNFAGLPPGKPWLRFFFASDSALVFVYALTVTSRCSVADLPAQVALYWVDPGPGVGAAFAHFDETPEIAVAAEAVAREHTFTAFVDADASVARLGTVAATATASVVATNFTNLVEVDDSLMGGIIAMNLTHWKRLYQGRCVYLR